MRVFGKGLQLGALLVVSCAQPPPDVIYACRTQADCPAGYACTALQEGRYCLDATVGTAGGTTAGGSAAGGSAAGGSAAGGSAAGGSAAGGSAAGGSAAGGSAAGGSAAGGSAAGGSAAGGSTAGGSAAGGSADGGADGGSDGGADGGSTCAWGDAGLLPSALQFDGGFVTTDRRILADAGLFASATSQFNGNFPPAHVLDSDLLTSWYAGVMSCPPRDGLFCCLQQSITVSLSTPRSISAVVIRGNRDFSGFELLTGYLEFVNGSGGVIARGSIVLPRPRADWAGRFAPPISNISQVRFVGGVARSPNPGISELELYAP